MARYIGTQLKARTGIAAADVAVPSNPEDANNVIVSPLPAGVWSTTGADKLRIDIASPVTTTGSNTLNIYAWDRSLGAWVSMGQAVVTAAAVGDFGGRLFGSVIVTDWCADFVAVMVQTIATNGGSGVGTSISVIPMIQDR